MSTIPTAYWTIIDPLISVARDLVKQGEQLAPVAFVGNLTKRETYPVLLNASSAQAKDDSAELIRKLAAIHEADFVFVIMDAWGLPPDKAPRYEKIIERYGSIGASPYRIDLVTFSLETRYGLWMAQVEVKNKGVSKRRRTFAAPEFRHFTDVQGRFVNLLPVKGADGPEVLH